ncbi:ABC transporter substrate-binding protein [Fodinicurvata halophila]|uniref:ABC transporter substrate-binding protein n=1 Tax=Fodinicurvata halophila TaxID=1419723 RepID=UPI0036414740
MTGLFAAQAQAQEQYLPSLVYRTGPYAPGGIGIADGISDYITLINERDGGINGVRIELEECETGYETDRGVECYERLKDRGSDNRGGPVVHGDRLRADPEGREDGITLHTQNYGRADTAYGPVLDWVFTVPGTYWSTPR